MPTAEQELVCRTLGVIADPVGSQEKAGVAIATLHLRALNGLRHPRRNGTSGWYIWDRSGPRR